MLEFLVTDAQEAEERPVDQRAYIGRVTVAFLGLADEGTSLVGREEELSRLRDLVASPYTETRVLPLLGDPGMGKTVLLAEAARGARSAGMRVLAAAGRESGKSHDRELRYVYITHPHADHFLGLPEILAEFPEARPVALAESIPAMEEQISPGYMQVWDGFFPGQLSGKPVPPVPLAGTTIPVGGSAATVIPVGTTDTGIPASSTSRA
jgi:hypothetical protein